MAELEVTRTVPTELPADDLWAMVGDAARWSEWMVDEVDVVIEPGAQGTVHEGGVTRRVRVDEVDEGRLSFTWWPAAEEHRASTVELVVVPTTLGSALRITERLAVSASAETATATAGIAWDVRTLLLVVATAPGLVVTA